MQSNVELSEKFIAMQRFLRIKSWNFDKVHWSNKWADNLSHVWGNAYLNRAYPDRLQKHYEIAYDNCDN